MVSWSRNSNCSNLAFGGGTAASTSTPSATESWNGSSWTTVTPSLNTSRSGKLEAGIQTASISSWWISRTPSITTETESMEWF
jgi:hypothetical protein